LGGEGAICFEGRGDLLLERGDHGFVGERAIAFLNGAIRFYLIGAIALLKGAIGFGGGAIAIGFWERGRSAFSSAAVLEIMLLWGKLCATV
jgi:hypothetical protein